MVGYKGQTPYILKWAYFDVVFTTSMDFRRARFRVPPEQLAAVRLVQPLGVQPRGVTERKGVSPRGEIKIEAEQPATVQSGPSRMAVDLLQQPQLCDTSMLTTQYAI